MEIDIEMEAMLESLDRKVFHSAMQWGERRYCVELEEWEAVAIKKFIASLIDRNESLMAENRRLNRELAPCADIIGKLTERVADMEHENAMLIDQLHDEYAAYELGEEFDGR